MQLFEDVEELWPCSDVSTSMIDIYSGPDIFLQDFNRAPRLHQTIFALYWFQAEVLNGGLLQFFSNDTGVLAPEAAAACHTVQATQLAMALEESMNWFATPYPRLRETRVKMLTKCDDDPFKNMDDKVVHLIYEENGGLEEASLGHLGKNT